MTRALASASDVLVDAGRPATGVELVAAAGRLRDDLDAPMPYWDQRRGAPDMERARATLDDESFATAVATGRGRDLDATTAMIAAELAALRTSRTGR